MSWVNLIDLRAELAFAGNARVLSVNLAVGQLQVRRWVFRRVAPAKLLLTLYVAIWHLLL